MSDYQLFHGDCFDVLPTLAPQSVDAVIADIPSGRTACAWDSVIPFDRMWKELKRVAKPRGAIVLLGCTQPFTSALIMSNVRQYRHSWVWDKKRVTGGATAQHGPMRAHEDIIVFARQAARYMPQMGRWTDDQVKRKRRNDFLVIASSPMGYADNIAPGRNSQIATGRHPDTLLRIPALGSRDPERTGHPTQKPLALLDYLIRTYTNPGDCVLDFCYGSGTTGAACGNLGRRFVGIEKDAAYFELGRERIATAYAPLRAMEIAI